MKGGRTAPRNHIRACAYLISPPRFNEGGADCPPKRLSDYAAASTGTASMKGGRTAPRNGDYTIKLTSEFLLQ